MFLSWWMNPPNEYVLILLPRDSNLFLCRIWPGAVPRYTVGDLESKIYDNVHHHDEAKLLGSLGSYSSMSFFGDFLGFEQWHMVWLIWEIIPFYGRKIQVSEIFLIYPDMSKSQ